MANIKGKKGGGDNPRTPVESPDSLHSIATAKILLALGEGEFAGGLTAKDILLDGTPKESVDGTVNFPDVTWEFRSGTQMQDYIPGMPAVENEITINTALKATQPWTRAISNTQLSAVRVRIGVPALQRQTDDGDVVNYRVEYKIELSVDGGGYSTILNSAFDGKTTSLYERSHRIDLPKASTGWQIRVSRSTPDSTSNRIADATNIAAYSEIIDAKLRYPNTALLFVTFDAKQFNNIPQISVKARGRIIRVPSNYDPISRAYSGTWDGSFKWAYSNNPAWVFYDVLLTERFGLGDRISASQVDKWELYRIAQYCDQPVPDGRGGSGTEPRFLCNIYIQSQNEAFIVLRDLASIFRGMTYWSNNQVIAIADMPAANDERNYIYTRANVIDGKFIYSSGSERDRYSTAMVSFSDPDNHYSDEPEPVFEADLVRRYGVRQTSITAIGCTRRTEANRRGRWILLTNAKDRLITFDAGLDGFIPQPGKIIYVADQSLSGRIMGGRISSVAGRVITLDRIPDAVSGDRLLVNLPSGKSEGRTVQAVNGKQVTVSAAWSMMPEPEAVWSVDARDVAIQQYRVTSVKDNDDNTFTISGVYHNPDKNLAIDSGARLDERPISAIPPSVQGPPTELSITSYSRVVQGLSVETLRVSWLAPPNAIAYECQWRKNNGDWISVPRTRSLGFEIEGIYSGRYTARVRAVNVSDISSVWAASAEVGLTGKVGDTPKPVGFMASQNIVFGIELKWGFAENTSDTLKTEIQYSATGNTEDAVLLADVPYPQHNYQQIGLKGGQAFWYRARLIDRLGNQSEWTEMIRGVASTDASDILDYLKGQIDETHLGQELNGKLGSISENQEALSRATIEARLQLEKTQQELDQKTASLSTDIDGVQENLNQAEKQLQSSVDQLNEKSVELSGDIDGVRNDLIEAEDRIQGSFNELESSTSQSIDDVRNDLTEAEGRIQSSVDAIDEAAYKTSQSIDSINRASIEAQLQLSQTQQNLSASSEKLSNDVSDVRKNLELAEADLQEKIDAVTGGSDQDIATVISQIEIIDEEQKKQASKVDAVIAQSDGNVAAIQREELARSDGDTALGKRIDVVKAETEDAAAKIVTLTDAQAGLESSQASIGQSLEAVTRAQLEGSLKQEGDVQAQREISARLTTSQQVLTDDQQALGRQITQIDTKYGDATAQLQEETKALSSENQALSGQFTALSAEVDANAATARDQTQAVATDLDAEVKRVTALKADVEGNTSSIQREELARSDGDTALGKRIDVVKAETEDAAAKIVTLTDAQAGLESSQASIGQSLEATNRAQLENALKQEGDVQAQREISARLTTSQQVLTDDQQALGRQITQIDTKYGDATAQLQEETKALSSENQALSGQFTALSAEVDANAATARDQTQAVATDLDAEVKRVTALKADVEGNTSSIQREELARSDGDTALGKRIDVVKAETEDAAAKIVTLTDAQAGLESSQASLSQSLEATNRAQLENALKQEGDVQAQREISARLTTSQQVLTDDQQALGRQITQIDTKYGDATAQLQEETKALSSENQALSGQFTALSAEVDANAATARDQTLAVATDLDAEVKRVTALKADVEGNTSSIQREELARSDGDTALGKRIDVVKAETEDAAAKIVTLTDAQAGLESSQASLSQSLEATNRAQLENALKQEGDVQAQREISARLTTSQQVLTDDQQALGRQITQIDTKYGDATAQLQEETKALSSENKALSGQFTALSAEVDANAATARDQTQAVATDLDAEVKRVTALKTDVEGNTSAIQREELARSDGDSALSQRIDVVKTDTGKNSSAITEIQNVQSDLQGSSASSQTSLEALARADLEGALKQQEDALSQNAAVARIDTKQEVQATKMIALARDITVVSAEVEGTQALVQQNMESVVELDGKISASWSMRVEIDQNGNPIVAGLGLGVDGEGNSQFLIYANRMAMISEANGQQYSPWAVENGEVFFNTALFKNASIDFGIITDTLQSDGFISGVNGDGWSLPKSGNAELNNVTVRGHVEALSGTFRGTVYATDGRFEGTVYADKIEGDVVLCGVWDQVLIYGVNEDTTRRFSGGLPYESVLVIPYLQVRSSSTISSGRCWIEINGRRIFESTPGPSASFANSVVVNLPAYATAEIKFVITGAGGGIPFGTPGPITVLVFKKSENRFTS